MREYFRIVQLEGESFNEWFSLRENSDDTTALEYLAQWDYGDRLPAPDYVDRPHFHGEFDYWGEQNAEGAYFVVWHWNLAYVQLYWVKGNDDA